MPTSFVVKNGSKIFGCRSSGMPGAVVVDLEHDGFLIRVVPGADDERAAAVGGQHRLLGVDDQVQQHLLHLVAVREHLGQAGGERVDDRDVGDALFVRAQRQRFAHHLVHVDHRARRLPLAREGQQVADDAGGAFRFARGWFRGRGAPALRAARCESRSAQLRIVASGLFSSCATPETVCPSAAIFSACSSWW